MKEKRKPTLQEISLYYDGLLPGEKCREVEEWLANDGEARRTLQLFKCFDSALETDLPEDRLESLLDGNLKGVHERLIQDDHQRRRESVSVWDWLLMPRNLLGGLAGLLILFGLFSAIESRESTVNPAVAVQGAVTPNPNTEPDASNVETRDKPVVDEAQKQVILAAAGLAKRAFSSGVGYAKERGKPLGDSLTVLPQTTNLGVALQSFASTATDNSQSKSVAESAPPTISPGDQLARTGAKQLALGLGASLLSLISVI